MDSEGERDGISIVPKASAEETSKPVEQNNADFLRAAYDFLQDINYREDEQSHKLPDFESLASAPDSLEKILQQVIY